LKRIITVVALAAFSMSLSAAEVKSTATGSRKRPVRVSAPQPATLQGRVIDATTRAPLGRASITVGEGGMQSAADGTFLVSSLMSGLQSVTVKRAGYKDVTQSVTLRGGANTLEIAMTPKPSATLTLMNATTVKLDPDSIEFGYVITFVGYDKGPQLRTCDSSGALTTIPLSSIARIPGPATMGAGASCCTGTTAQHVTVELKNGTTVDAMLRDTCTGYKEDLIALNATTGEPVFVGLANVSRLVMP
jgi:hypothetical protein